MTAQVPFTASGVTVLCLGEAVSDEGYIKKIGNKMTVFPVGYKVSRMGPSKSDPNGEVPCTAEIIRGPEGPLFVVVCSDEPDVRHSANSATGVWQNLYASRRPDKKCSINGLAKFGLHSDAVAAAIGQLRITVSNKIGVPLCATCGLDTPFCSVTGMCHNCGLRDTPFCAVTGKLHSAAAATATPASGNKKRGKQPAASAEVPQLEVSTSSTAHVQPAVGAGGAPAPVAQKVPRRAKQTSASIPADVAVVVDGISLPDVSRVSVADAKAPSSRRKTQRSAQPVEAAPNDMADGAQAPDAPAADENPKPAKAPRGERRPPKGAASAGGVGAELRQTKLTDHKLTVPAAPEVPKGPPPLRPVLSKKDTNTARHLMLDDAGTKKRVADACGTKSKSAQNRYAQFLWMYTSERAKVEFVRKKPQGDSDAAAAAQAPVELDAAPSAAAEGS